MYRKASRKIWKRALWWSRVKLLYARITLTKFTTLFFFLSLVSCFVLVSLQSVAFADNYEATGIIGDLLSVGNVTHGIVLLAAGELWICSDIPSLADSDELCHPIGNDSPSKRSALDNVLQTEVVPRANASPFWRRGLQVDPDIDRSGHIDGVVVNKKLDLDTSCLEAYMWVNDLLLDSSREDVVILAFQLWLLVLSVVAILNESLPHLVAALFGHVLETGWAAYRTVNSMRVSSKYLSLVVDGSCNGTDILGTWWDTKIQHTIPVVIVDVIVLLAVVYLSSKLFKVYAHQSFSRVGASNTVHNVYKVVLIFSVLLQLASFFVIATIGMWINKVTFTTHRVAIFHFPLYITAFVIMPFVVLPWLVLGWISVRRENPAQFLVFCFFSVIILILSSLMFANTLYRLIFSMWPFFATMTITAFLLIVATSGLGVFCRLHFGKGLAEFLRVTEELEGMDFTPVNFSTDDGKASPVSSKDILSSHVHVISIPYIQKPAPPSSNMARLSVYSNPAAETVMVSSTPPLVKEGSPLSPSRDSRLSLPPGISGSLQNNSSVEMGIGGDHSGQRRVLPSNVPVNASRILPSVPRVPKKSTIGSRGQIGGLPSRPHPTARAGSKGHGGAPIAKLPGDNYF